MRIELKSIIGGVIRFYDGDSLLHRGNNTAIAREFGRWEWRLSGVQSPKTGAVNSAQLGELVKPSLPGTSSKLVLTDDR